MNDAGGIALKKFNKKVPVELIAYDDQGKPDELLKLTERLVQQDKVDMILSPYATHMNLASAPIVNKYEYPVIMTTATTNKTYDLGSEVAVCVLEHLAAEGVDRAGRQDARRPEEGRARSRAASPSIHPALEYGVEMNAAFVDAAKKDGLEVVITKSYPFGASDLQPLIREAMATNPDAFIAFSYPPDTFMLTEQAQIVGFNPQLMYVAIGGVFPTYKGKFGNKVNGILAYGGADPNSARHGRVHQGAPGHVQPRFRSGRGAASMLRFRSRSRRSSRSARSIARRSATRSPAARSRPFGATSGSRTSSTPILGPSANGRTANSLASPRPTSPAPSRFSSRSLRGRDGPVMVG